jgi:hypothetical protein
MKKTLMIAAAFATLIGSSAFAQSYDPDMGSGNVVATPYAYTPASEQAGHGGNEAFAQAPADAVSVRPSRPIANFDGAVESDPDRNIRFELRREAQEGW